MICPVCENGINDNSKVCPICGFANFQKEFINCDEANNWIQNIVKPYRKKWKYSIDISYLTQSRRYADFVALRMNVERTPANYEAVIELVGLLYGIIFNPTHKNGKIILHENGIQELIKLCKHYISRIDFSKSDLEKQVVQLRLIYLSALLSLVEGDVSTAYDLFVSVARMTEAYSRKTDKFIGTILALFVYSEVNIHQILVMFGVADDNFFDNEQEELAFFANHNMPLEYTSTLGYIVSSYTPLYHKYINPFADMHYSAVAHNMRTLYMFVKNNELKITIRCVGNKEFIENNNECEWHLKRNINAEAIKQYLEQNRYKKINGKIHNIIGFANADT